MPTDADPTRERSAGIEPTPREQILTRYPYPIARAYARVVSETDVAARYGALLDTFETLLRFLVFALFSEYRKVAGDDPARDRLLSELIRKRGLSTGDWSNMLLTCAAAFRGREHHILPELSAFLFDARGKVHPRTAWITELTRARNRHWGHRIGRTSDFYDQRLKVDLPDLERALETMNFLGDLRLIVPTRLVGAQVTEGIIYTGMNRVVGVPLAFNLPDDGLEVQPYGSVLLQRGSERSVSVFPFLRYREALDESQRGLYFLEDWEWVRRKDNPQLRVVTYLAENPGAPAETDRKFALVVQRSLFRLLPAIEHLLRDSLDDLSPEDPDWEIPSVWAERELALRVVVGRTELLNRVRDRLARTADGGLLVLKGAPGMGKSSFLYLLHEELRERGALLHSIRCNASPDAFLRSLLYQCGQLLERPLGSAAYAGESVDALRASLEHHMLEVSRARGTCVALIDALDEMPVTSEQWEASLAWLPRALPPGVFVVVTCRPHASLLRALRSFVPSIQFLEWELEPLTPGDLVPFTRRYLQQDAAHVQRVIDLDAAFERVGGHPLYLRIVLEEVASELRTAAAERRRPRRIHLHRLEANQGRQMEAVWESITGRRSGADPVQCARRRLLLEYLAVARSPGLSAPLCRLLLERTLQTRLPSDELSGLLESVSAWLREPVRGRLLPFHLTLTEYVLQQLGEDLRSARRLEIATALTDEGARVDPEYWWLNVTDHALEGGMEASRCVGLLTEEPLILARINDSGGALHGAFIVRHLHGAGPEERARFATRFVHRWSADDARVKALSTEAREQLAELFKAAPLPGFGAQAQRLYELLHRETDDPEYLLRRAWVSYQLLDEWSEARACLATCIESLQADGSVREAAKAQRLLAGIVFDAGDASEDPETILRDCCLPAFSEPSEERERAFTWETIGVVVDAEARWEEALACYEQAATIHAARRSFGDLDRVRLNRSIASLFTEGPGAAIADIECISSVRQATGDSQLARYYRANRCLMALLDGALDEFDRLYGDLKDEEPWVTLTCRESLAVRRWFGGDPDRAITEMAQLAEEFDALDDAWGRIDNGINIGLIHLARGRTEEARAELELGYARSEEQDYPVGRAVAGEGLRRLGQAARSDADAAFYERHLGRLFERCPSPFVPCYLLLMP